ncbi:hypothetical protein Tco_1546288 [Tanacetum coccineum]
MSQPANDDFSQHHSDDEASYHEDASDNVFSTDITNKFACRKFLIRNVEEIFTVRGDGVGSKPDGVASPAMLYLLRRSLEVLRKFHWTTLGGRSNQLSHVSSLLLSKPGEY